MVDNEFVAFVVDAMQILGPVTARPMFGGHGLFLRGRMFALIARGDLYLKADDATIPMFSERKLEAFTYSRQGKCCRLSYFRAPEEVFETSDDMLRWAGRAHQVAMRSG